MCRRMWSTVPCGAALTASLPGRFQPTRVCSPETCALVKANGYPELIPSSLTRSFSLASLHESSLISSFIVHCARARHSSARCTVRLLVRQRMKSRQLVESCLPELMLLSGCGEHINACHFGAIHVKGSHSINGLRCAPTMVTPRALRPAGSFALMMEAAGSIGFSGEMCAASFAACSIASISSLQPA